MRNPLPLCLAVAITAACVQSAAPQPPVLRAGVSVEMPVTKHAVPMPEADGGDALIVAVTRKPTVYLGITPITLAQLTAELKKTLTSRASKNIYVKADARVSYANVAGVLTAIREAGIDAPILLTSQPHSADTQSYVLPQGLRVRVGPAKPSSISVQAQGQAPSAPTLSIQGAQTTTGRFSTDLANAIQGQPSKQVYLRADEALTFGDVVQVVDLCLGTGVEVTLAVPAR